MLTDLAVQEAVHDGLHESGLSQAITDMGNVQLMIMEHDALVHITKNILELNKRDEEFQEKMCIKYNDAIKQLNQKISTLKLLANDMYVAAYHLHGDDTKLKEAAKAWHQFQIDELETDNSLT